MRIPKLHGEIYFEEQNKEERFLKWECAICTYVLLYGVLNVDIKWDKQQKIKIKIKKLKNQF